MAERTARSAYVQLSDFNDTFHCVCLLLTSNKMRFNVLACRVAVFWDVTPWDLVEYTGVLERVAASSFSSLVYPHKQ